jgi:hypothetical protein
MDGGGRRSDDRRDTMATTKRIEQLARKTAHAAVMSARENGSRTPERDAADYCDDTRALIGMCGQEHLRALSSADLRAVSQRAMAILEGK